MEILDYLKNPVHQ